MANTVYSDEEKDKIKAEFKKRRESGLSVDKALQGLGPTRATLAKWAPELVSSRNGTSGKAKGAARQLTFKKGGYEITLTAPLTGQMTKAEMINALTDDDGLRTAIRAMLKVAMPATKQGTEN